MQLSRVVHRNVYPRTAEIFVGIIFVIMLGSMNMHKVHIHIRNHIRYYRQKLLLFLIVY